MPLPTDYEMWDLSCTFPSGFEDVSTSHVRYRKLGVSWWVLPLQNRNCEEACAHAHSTPVCSQVPLIDDQIKHNEGGSKDGQNSHNRNQEMVGLNGSNVLAIRNKVR